MNKNIFVNIATNDLPRTMKFWEDLGYTFNKQFTDETAACLVFSENIYAMILTQDKMKEFTKDREIADARKTTEVLLALSCGSKEEVDRIVGKAIELGAKKFRDDKEYDFMYTNNFEDLDGHVWEFIWMDPNFLQK